MLAAYVGGMLYADYAGKERHRCARYNLGWR